MAQDTAAVTSSNSTRTYSLTFHGFWSFIAEKSTGKLWAVTPLTNDHTYAVRFCSSPQSGSPNDPSNFLLLSRGGLEYEIGSIPQESREERLKDPFPKSGIIRVKDADTISIQKGEHLFYSISISRVPDRIDLARFTSGKDQPFTCEPDQTGPGSIPIINAEQNPKYALIQRFVFTSKDTLSVSVNSNYPVGLDNLFVKYDDVHFYAEGIREAGRGFEEAFEAMKATIPNFFKFKPRGAEFECVSIPEEDQISFTRDQMRSLGEWMGVDPCSPFFGANVRNCISLYTAANNVETTE